MDNLWSGYCLDDALTLTAYDHIMAIFVTVYQWELTSTLQRQMSQLSCQLDQIASDGEKEIVQKWGFLSWDEQISCQPLF